MRLVSLRSDSWSLMLLAVFLASGCGLAETAEPDESKRSVDMHLSSGSTAPARLASGNWAAEIHRYIDRDALQVQVARETGTMVLNQRGFRAIVDRTTVALVAPGVEIGDVDASVRSPTGAKAWGLRYRLEAIDTGDTGVSLDAGSSRHEGALASIHHGSLVTQEYENLDDAIEQRFVIHEGKGESFVLVGRIEGGVDLFADDDGLSVFSGRNQILHATAPRAFDATGRELQAAFVTGPGRLDIEVRGVTEYPVLVDPHWTAIGDVQMFSNFGYSVASAGDIDNNGYDDVIVGCPYFNTTVTSAGKVYVYMGSASGLATTPAWTSSGDDVIQANFGQSVASAGSVNGDAHSDIIIGAPGQAGGGKVFVYLGHASGPVTPPVWEALSPYGLSDHFGYSVASAGDVNNDGFDDVVMGDPFYGNTDLGLAVVFSGAAYGVELFPSWSAFGTGDYRKLGNSVASAGDVNRDGYDDVIVGIPRYPPNNRGAANIYLGSQSGLNPSRTWLVRGYLEDGAEVGYAVASGDFNGDGFGDIVVGAPYSPGSDGDAGRTFVYLCSASGPSPLPSWTSDGDDQAGSSYGWSVASAGDVNGDGFDDLIVGCPSFSTATTTSAGKAYLHLGSSVGIIGTTPAWSSSAEDDGFAGFGRSVATAGDVNGDGFDDVIVGAPLRDTGAGMAGKAYVYLGADAPSGLCDPAGVTCDDHNQCTTSDVCHADGSCFGAAVNCDDGNPCTTDSCDPATGCVHTSNSNSCNDNNACTTNDTCSGGACTGTPVDCDDNNPCTDDNCQVANGCFYVDNTDPCNDGNACTTNDACSGGTCSGTAVSCDDANPCTDDECNPATGCSHANNTASCDDGNDCTTNDTCADGTCAGSPLDADGDGHTSNGCGGDDCDDGNPGIHPGIVEAADLCADSLDNDCDGATDTDDTGCQMCSEDADCDDQNVCNGDESCVGGQCVPGSPLDCDDGNSCTDDACDAIAGCASMNNAASCDDGDVCTMDDVCSGGSCRGAPLDSDGDGHASAGCGGDDCLDTNDQVHPGMFEADALCTDGVDNDCDGDTDDADAGCLVCGQDAECDDGSACNGAERCQDGSCVAGEPLSCDDGDPCTDDACEPATGCVSTDNTAACDDGDVCTMDEVCSDGACIGEPMDADGDGYVSAGCGGDDCLDSDAQVNPGAFEAGESCDDTIDNDCDGKTDDADQGCTPCGQDADCDDGDLCNGTERCEDGSCVADEPVDCDDGNDCTVDSCDPASGCRNEGSCGDGGSQDPGDAGGCGCGYPVKPAGFALLLIVFALAFLPVRRRGR